MTETLDEWVYSTSRELQLGRLEFFFDSRHVDELGLQWSGPQDMKFILARLLRASRLVGQDDQLAVAFTMLDSDAPLVALPNLETVELDVYVPPTVYLFGSQHFALTDDTERHRVRYQDDPWGFGPENLMVEVLSWRDKWSLEQGFPYSNALHGYLRPGSAVRARPWK